jgi:cytochrome bd-type quinol oxidase subunit 2
MVHVKRAVGYVQISLGIMLIFGCFIASDTLLEQLVNQNSKLFSTYDELAHLMNASLTPQQHLDSLYVMEVSSTNAHFTIQAMVVIVFVLSVMMILQGVANTQSGKEDDIPQKEIGKFIIVMFLLLYVIAAAYVLIFKSAPSRRLFDGLSFLVILAAFTGITSLVQHIIKKKEHKKHQD